MHACMHACTHTHRNNNSNKTQYKCNSLAAVPWLEGFQLWDLSHREGYSGLMTPVSGYTDIVITSILLSPAGTLGLKQNVCCVKSPMSGSLWPLAIFMATKTPLLKYLKAEYAAGVVGNIALIAVLCTAERTGVGKWLRTPPSHPTPGEPQGFSWGMLATATTTKQQKQLAEGNTDVGLFV